MNYLRGLLMGWSCFTAIPAPSKKWWEEERRTMLATLPLIGMFLGMIGSGFAMLMGVAGLPLMVMSSLMAAYPFLITGGIHLDGFMDCSDAIMSKQPMEKKKKILKDPTVGSFAVMSFVLSLLIMLGAMYAICDEGHLMKMWLIAGIMAVTRANAAVHIMISSAMEGSQYANIERGKRKDLIATGIACFIGIFASWMLFAIFGSLGEGMFRPLMAMIVPVVLAGATSVFASRYGIKQLGGMNGDIAGYSIVLGETVGLVALSVV